MSTEANIPTREASLHQTAQEGHGEEQEMEQRGNRLAVPDDGYEWRKYGQKFIKNIGKVRSYFKCQKTNCMAKKRAEWCKSEPSTINIKYEGEHNHGLVMAETVSSQSSSSNNANQYNLLTQVLESNQHLLPEGRQGNHHQQPNFN